MIQRDEKREQYEIAADSIRKLLVNRISAKEVIEIWNKRIRVEDLTFAYHQLMHYYADEDIRAHDKKYAHKQLNSIKEELKKIELKLKTE